MRSVSPQRHRTRREFLRLCGWTALAGSLAPGVCAAVAARRTEDADLGFLAGQLALKQRRTWTDVAARPWRLHEAGGFDRITIHHAGNGVVRETAENAVVFRLQNMQTAHLRRNYGDIGYHFIIDYAGRTWEGRSLAYEGAHVSHHNRRNVGIMVIGNFEKQRPSDAQIKSCEVLVGLLREHYRIKKNRVYGHRDLGHSICPGRHLYARLADLKR